MTESPVARAGGSRRRQRQPASRPIPALDATQKQVISALKTTRESWHESVDPYRPLKSHLSVQPRYATGKALRSAVARESHAEWSPPENRPSAVDLVLAGNVGRQPELVPLRMARMAASPFAFLRGAAAVMAWDLSHTPISGIQTLIDGDAHLDNFGLYGTPEREIVLDLNDFDEGLYGPWEWDIKRLVASVNVAARENGFNRRERRRAVTRCAAGYRLNLQRYQAMGILDMWSVYTYADRRPEELEVPNKAAWNLIQRTVEKARATTNETLLPKLARRRKNGEWRFAEDPPILKRVANNTRKRVIESLREYAETVSLEHRHLLRRYSVADVAHRVVGVGSVGTRAYLVLLFGNGDTDPLFLQVKEAGVPAHAPYLPPASSQSPNQGLRVVTAQRGLQATGDPLLGYTAFGGRDYFVRQMKNMKASMPLEWLKGNSFFFWGSACGALLARAHCRNGDAAKLAGYCGKSEVLDEALTEFAEAYADQTETDHAALIQAIQNGRVKAKAGA